jgi:non-ribosomal peptide synthetase component F
MLVYENYPFEATTIDDESCGFLVKAAESVENPSIPLSVIVGLVDSRLEVMCLYDTGRFPSADAVDRISYQLCTALKGLISTTSHDIVGSVSLSDHKDIALVNQWNQTDADFPRSKSVHGMFEEIAATRPDAIAAVYIDEQISFAELNRRANTLAHFLIAVGVQPGSLISLCMYRSIELLVAMLAIFKAGCSYVPIEPTYPRARQILMHEDSQSVLLLTQASIISQFQDYPALAVDSAWNYIRQQKLPTENLTSVPFDPKSLAYIIYTSGSTGSSGLRLVLFSWQVLMYRFRYRKAKGSYDSS